MKILIIALLSLITYDAYSACAPGAVPCENAGIENFKVQTVDPTFTASPGEKGLFNTNSQFKTKDEFGNVQRLVTNENILSLVNGDVEEGLTGFAGIGTVNILTPLKGLKSLNLDTTALNDFAETTLALIPRNLMGQVCMARVDIKGGDANLQLQVVNGAGTIVGFKQLAVFTDSTPQFITFQCPTQALITATPALGQLKIKIVQSTVTNAALATLDSFYLGVFSSNTMNVMDQPQWYYYTVNADINGGFAFPAPTASGGSGLFSYIGTTLTALKQININFDLGINQNTTAAHASIINLNCIVSGVNRNYPVSSDSVSGTGALNNSGQSKQFILNNGDTCTISMTRNGDTVSNYFVNITATPLPSLASIVTSPNLPAGFYAGRTWNSTCAYVTASSSFVDFPNTPACGAVAPSNSGFAMDDTTANGQTLKITLSKYEPGTYTVVFNSLFNCTTSGGSGAAADCSWRVNDGVNTSGSSESHIVGAGASGLQSGYGSNVFTIKNATPRQNAVLTLQGLASTGSTNNQITISAGRTAIAVYYQPDLSNPYTNSMIAALPPQVTNSSGKSYIFEQCYVTNGGTASLGSTNCNTFVQSVNRTAVGRVTVNFIPGIFTVNALCNVTPVVGSKTCNVSSISNVSLSADCDNPNVSGSDTNFVLSCGGFK